MKQYQYSVTPVTTGNRKLIGAVLLLRDVTKLKEIDRLKSDFIITASHELKTPLHSIGMSVALLKESLGAGLSAKDAELLQATGDEVARLNTLVADLLDLSRIEAGKIELKVKPIDPSLILTDAAKRHAQQAEQAGIVVSTDCGCVGPVLADRDKLSAVLGNLIGNAVKYGETVTSIGLECRAAGEFCRFSVRDDGIGIPEQYHATIFDKFVRVPAASGKSGTGLGLTICREIVRAHGGTIWVATPARGGCEFSFTIPAAGADRKRGRTA
jgi:NtrC-family two-component system sensor histidine kinase KinB